MKILYVGFFSVPWSADFPRAMGLLNQSHKVFCFEYRSKNQNKIKSSYQRFQEKSVKGQIIQIEPPHNITIKQLLRKFYLRFINKITNNKISFFEKISNINKYYLFSNWKINRQLLNEVKKKKYDLVFLSKIDGINYNLISKFNKYTKTLYLFMDHLNTALEVNAVKYASLSTWTVANKSSVNLYFKREGINSYFITEGVNTRVFKPSIEKVNKEIDVIFVGSISPKREKFIDLLKKNNINIICYGYGWENKPIFLEELADKYRKSKIILNFTRGDSGFSDRVLLTMASGSLIISEYCRDFEKFFKKGVHLEWFKTPKELLELVKFYLENETNREKIAQKGNKKVLKNFTWDKKMGEIIQIITKSKDFQK